MPLVRVDLPESTPQEQRRAVGDAVHEGPATARRSSDEVLVTLRGGIVERGPSDEAVLDPQHDDARLLLEACPDPEKRLAR